MRKAEDDTKVDKRSQSEDRRAKYRRSETPSPHRKSYAYGVKETPGVVGGRYEDLERRMDGYERSQSQSIEDRAAKSKVQVNQMVLFRWCYLDSFSN